MLLHASSPVFSYLSSITLHHPFSSSQVRLKQPSNVFPGVSTQAGWYRSESVKSTQLYIRKNGSSPMQQENNNKLLLIVHHNGYELLQLFRVSVDSLFPAVTETSNQAPEISELELSFADSPNNICTTTIGLGPRIFLFGGGVSMFRYDLHDTCNLHKCFDIPAELDSFMSVQVGDSFYVLSFSSLGKFVFYKYRIEDDEWALVHDVAGITNKSFNYPKGVSRNCYYGPHVVIGCKLHVSLGKYAFAYDTDSGVWEYSNLFDSFWSEHHKSGLSPPNFYGTSVWNDYADSHTSVFVYQPFGFYGKAIIWDTNVMLGVHGSSECQVVAFLLDDKDRVVKSQPFAFMDVPLTMGARLVDLGRDGYFGLLHFTSDDQVSFVNKKVFMMMELVIFKVSRPLQPRDDHFLECHFESKYIVERSGMKWGYNAFCV